MTLGDAAICCGVGRRFLLDLESGKPTAQFAKVLQVLDTFGMGLALTGTGASFTEEDLRETTVERGEVVWEAEFEKGLPDLPGEETGDGIRRGRPIGAKKISPRRLQGEGRRPQTRRARPPKGRARRESRDRRGRKEEVTRQTAPFLFSTCYRYFMEGRPHFGRPFFPRFLAFLRL